MAERRKYTREFKFEAVRLVVEEERPLAAVAKELGIERTELQRWKRALEERTRRRHSRATGGSEVRTRRSGI